MVVSPPREPSADGASGLLPALVGTLPMPLQKYLCAAFAASLAEAVTMPLDVIKTRMQVDLTPLSTSSSSGANAAPARLGLLSTGRLIYQTEGASRLYIGLAPAMLRQAIVGGIGIGLYPQIKDLCVRAQRGAGALADAPPTGAPLSIGMKVLSGAASGVIGQLLAAPTCVVKVRLQSDARLPVPRYLGTIDAFTRIGQQEGFRAYFSGLVPSLQRAAVMYGATGATYDTAKHAIVGHLYQGDARAMDFVSTHVASSSISGLAASIVSTPFDTVKTRLISQSAGQYSGMVDCVVQTVRSEGAFALYKGIVACYARLAPWQLTFFVAFEQLSIAVTGQSMR